MANGFIQIEIIAVGVITKAMVIGTGMTAIAIRIAVMTIIAAIMIATGVMMGAAKATITAMATIVTRTMADTRTLASMAAKSMPAMGANITTANK